MLIPKYSHVTDVQKRKKFNEHKITEPIQLSLFKFLEETDLNTDKYSQTIDLYDFMPKYVWDARSIVKEGDVVMREFECKGVKRLLAIHPASLVNHESRETKYKYPGGNEHLVEEVLRKLAVHGGGKFLDDSAAVAFSVYQIRQELKLHGHTMSHNQILESLDILALTRLELINIAKKNEKIIFSPIENLGISGRDDETQTFVVFSPLVTRSILQKTFRLYNYGQVMSYRSVISRLLHKRMAHHFTQASIATRYTISVSTIVRDFGLTPQPRIKSNKENIEKALIEMKTGYLPKTLKEAAKINGIRPGFRPTLLKYEINPVLDVERKNKIVDYLIHLTPTHTFAGETMTANKVENHNKTKPDNQLT
jgi:hypothetical protein